MRTKLVGFPKNLAPGEYPVVVTSVTCDADGKLTMVLADPALAAELGRLKHDEDARSGVAPQPRDLATPQEIAEAVAATLREYGWDVTDVQTDPKHWILGAERDDAASLSMVFAVTQ